MNSRIYEPLCNITNQACSDELYGDAASQWVDSKVSKLVNRANVLCRVIDDPTITLTNDEKNFPISLTNGNFVTVDAIQQALANGLDTVQDMSSNTVNIDDVIQQFNSSLNDGKVLSEAIKSAKDSVISTDVSNPFLIKIQNVLNFDGSKLDMAGMYLDILTNKSSSVKEKVSGIMSLQYSNNDTSDSKGTNSYLTSLDNSPATQATGASAFQQIGAGIANFASSIDLSSVKDAVVSGCKAVGKALNRAGNWLKNNSVPYIMKYGRKITDFINLQHCDIQANSGGNGCLNNAYLLCNMSSEDLETFLFFYDDENKGYSRTAVRAALESLPENQTMVSEIPGAEISVTRVLNDPDGYNLRVGIRLKLIDYKSAKTWFNEYEGTPTVSEVFTALSGMYATETSLDETDYSYDDYYFNALLFGKALAYYYVHEIWQDRDFDALWTATDTINILALCDTSGNMNPTLTIPEHTVGLVTYLDPTNSDFFEVATKIGDMDEYEWDFTRRPNRNQDVFFGLMAAYMGFVKDSNSLSVNNFIPYAYRSVMSKGSFTIMSDANNLSQFWARTGGVLLTAAAITAVIAIPTAIKNVKINAVTANLQAGTLQSQIQAKLASGLSVSDSELNQMYKATKKAVRLNKLTGGFASITTGLSTWGSNSGVSNILTNEQQITNVEKLIAG